MKSGFLVVGYADFPQWGSKLPLTERPTHERLIIRDHARVFVVDGYGVRVESKEANRFALRRDGDTLIVELDGGQVVELVDFYRIKTAQLLGDIWAPSAGTLLSALSDNGGYALTSYQSLLSDANGSFSSLTALAGGGGVLGLLGAASSGSRDQAEGAERSRYALEVNVVAGPVIGNHQLTVGAYGLNGRVLHAPTALGTDGSVSITLPVGYAGVVLLRVFDGSEAADYIDEATAAARDLPVDLRAVIDTESVSGRTQAVTISPLSELVVRSLLGEAASASTPIGHVITPAQAGALTGTNAKWSSFFGFDREPARMDAVTAIDHFGALQEPNAMGAVLAALSGMEHQHQTLDQVLRAVLGDDLTAIGDDLAKGALAVSEPVFRWVVSSVEEVSTLVGGGLPSTFLQALNTEQVQNLTPEALAAVSPTQILGFDAAQVQALRGDQLRALSTAQIAVLDQSGRLDLLDPLQRVSLMNDQTPPSPLTLALLEDSGVSATDNISNAGLIRVVGLEAGAGWQYALDDGAWIEGSNNYLYAMPGTHAYRVRQIDAAGNVGTSDGSFTRIVYDTNVPTVVVTDDAAAIARGAINYTFAFSEPVIELQADDITVVNGSKGALTRVSDSLYTLVVTPVSDLEGEVTVTLDSKVLTDIAGNSDSLTTVVSQQVDTIKPLVEMASNMPGVARGAFTHTFSFSEPIHDFDLTDVAVAASDGTQIDLGLLTQVGLQFYTLLLTPPVGFEGTVTVGLAADVVSDIAGNGNDVALSLVQTVDTRSPSILIGHDANGTINADMTVTFTFSESVTDFDAQDVVVTNAQKSLLTRQSDTLYALMLTPSQGVDGDISVSVAKGAFADAVGNLSQTSAHLVQAVDTLSPSLTITNDAGLIATSEITYLFTFSEAVSGFDLGDLSVSNATLGNLIALSDRRYSLSVKPLPSFEGSVRLEVAEAAVKDVSGNSIAGTSSEQMVDSVAPRVLISDDVAGVATGTVTYTFAFSEEVVDFEVDDVTVANASKSGFTRLDAKTYSLLVTPFSDFEGEVSVGLSAGVTTDLAGNSNLSAQAMPQGMDSLAPAVSGVELAGATGAKNQTLDAADVITVSLFLDDVVVVTGTPTLDLNIGGHVVQARYVEGSGGRGLTFRYAIESDQSDPDGISIGVDAVKLNGGSIRDAAGNDAQLATLSLNDDPRFLVSNGRIDLSHIAEGIGGFVINGQMDAAQSGYSVSSAGDVNGDGLMDLIIGTGGGVSANTQGLLGIDAPRSYVVFGQSGSQAVDLAAIAQGQGGGFVLLGESGTGANGFSVSQAGDINGDGLADLLLGTRFGDPSAQRAGLSYVVFGKADVEPVDLREVGFNRGGFVLNGGSAGDQSGYSVAPAGDVNGDGWADLVIGAPMSSPDATNAAGAGQSYVVFGRLGLSSVALSDVGTSVDGFVIRGELAGDGSGWSVSGAGDVNGDGLADLIVGSPMLGEDDGGRAYVVFGKTGNAAVDLSAIASLDGTDGFAVTHALGAGGNSGWDVSAAGDVNGDGLADLLIATPFTNANGTPLGRSHVVFGKADGASLDLGGVGGFSILGEDTGSQGPISVANVGDMNGDGLTDLLVGVAGAAGGAGRSYVVFGQTDVQDIELSAVARGVGGFAISGQSTGGASGISVSAAGDVNGDGLADLIVSAPDYGLDGGGSGRSYVVFGATTGVFQNTKVDHMGSSEDDTLISTGAQTLIGNAGNDSFYASGADVLYGGAGDDVFVVDAKTVTALRNAMGTGGNVNRLARIDGGSGLDILRLDGGAELDLTQIANQGAGTPGSSSRIESIEIIDLVSDTASNRLVLTANDVVDMAGMNLFNLRTGWVGLGESVSRHQLVVTGAANDTVEINEQDWVNAGVVTHDGASYTTWNSVGSAAQLIVQNDNLNETALNTQVTLELDRARYFLASDFGPTAGVSGSQVGIVVTGLPRKGELTLDGIPVAVNQEVTATDLSRLLYTPESGGLGERYASIEYVLTEGGLLVPEQQALQLNGTNAFVDLGPMSIGGEITLETWFKSDSADRGASLFDLGNGNAADGIVLTQRYLSVSAGSVEVLRLSIPDDAIQAGAWTHIAATIEDNRIAMVYVDGEVVALGRLSSDLPTLERTDNFIGKSSSSTSLFEGQIAEARIYSDARTQSEVRADMNGNVDLAESRLLRYEPFDGAVSDVSVVNGPVFAARPNEVIFDVTGGRIIWGDGSGYGVTSLSSLSSTGGGDDDKLHGTEQADIIFGDGSGGGRNNSGTLGKAGAGADTLIGGGGDDLLFGDGFTPFDRNGGYGGGGGGETQWYGPGGVGGIGAGAGYAKGSVTGDPSWLGPLNVGTRIQSLWFGSDGANNWVGGAGVRSGNVLQGSATDMVWHDLSDAAASNVARYGGRSVYDKVLWDLSQGTDGFGLGQQVSDATGTGNGGANIDQRLYSQTMGKGDDVLRGGRGNDWLMGGGGADVFVWAEQDFDGGQDYVIDFSVTEGDLLRFDVGGFVGYEAGEDLTRWFKVDINQTVDSPFQRGTGAYTRLMVDLSGQGNFEQPDQSVWFRGDALSSTSLLTVIELVSDGFELGANSTMGASLDSATWSVDRGTPGSLGEQDVIRLVFSEPVRLNASSVSGKQWGYLPHIRALYPEGSLSVEWEVTLGTDAAITKGLDLSLMSVKDAYGNVGTIDGALNAELAEASIKPFNATELYNGITYDGWTMPSTDLRLVWGGVSSKVSSDASGYWRYTFYENESLFGHQIPEAGIEHALQLYQVHEDGTTTLLWSQTAQADVQAPELVSVTQQGTESALDALAPGDSVSLAIKLSEDLGRALTLKDLQVFGGQLSGLTGAGSDWTVTFTANDAGLAQLARVGVAQGQLLDAAGNRNGHEQWLYIAVANGAQLVLAPVTRELDIRAGRQVSLDLRDPGQDLSQGAWRVHIEGLAGDQQLSHGERNAIDGSWLVSGADLSALQLITDRNATPGHTDVSVRYQAWRNGQWVDSAQAVVSVNVQEWLAVPATSSVEDYQNFTQVQEAWNLGLSGLTGRGVSVEAEGSQIVLPNSDFTDGNVLAGSATGTSANHGSSVGQRIAGAWDSRFVGVAYGAEVGWGNSIVAFADIDNNSWTWGAGTWGNGSSASNDPAIANGRGGLGQIVVFASSNYGWTANVSFMQSQKLPAYVSIGSLHNQSGEVTSFTTIGEALHGVAPGLGGTSFASPHVAGIVALMLEANAGLGFRDVQTILAYGATYLKTDTPFKGFELNGGVTLNGAGMHFSRSAGFGVVNAYNATRMARDWLRGDFAAATVAGWTHYGATDPATYSVSKTQDQVTRITIDVTNDIRLDSLQLQATYTDPQFDKLEIYLISPSGTVSPIAVGNTQGGGSRANLNLQVTSKRFWGEEAAGTWTLEYWHSANTSADAVVSKVRLIFFGEAGQVSQRHVFTDERMQTWEHMADAGTRAQMLWVDDRDGGQDVIMGSALTQAITVHLGRNGWITQDGLTSGFTPGTEVENAFGGDGDDVLVGLAAGASLLLGNQGSDVLMGFGQGSQVEGGDDGDWLWVGGDTVAIGGGGADRFVVYNGASTLSSSASIAAQLIDFDANEDVLISYDKAGTFEVARFDLQGDVSSWVTIEDLSYLEQLQAQLGESTRPDVVSIDLAQNSLTLDFGMPFVHEAANYSAWLLSGQSPTGVTALDSSLTLTYDQLPQAGQVLDLSGADLYSTLGVGLPYQALHLGDSGGNNLDASAQTQPVVLYGAGGADTLVGGSASDLLLASTGSDSYLTGGDGADVFRFDGLLASGGVAQIKDFSADQGDTLDIFALLDGLDSTIDFLGSVFVQAVDDSLWVRFDESGEAGMVNGNFAIELDGFYTNNALSVYDGADYALEKLLYAQHHTQGVLA